MGQLRKGVEQVRQMKTNKKEKASTRKTGKKAGRRAARKGSKKSERGVRADILKAFREKIAEAIERNREALDILAKY